MLQVGYLFELDCGHLPKLKSYKNVEVVAQVYMEVVVQDMWRWWQQNMWGWLRRLCRGDGAMYVEVVA